MPLWEVPQHGAGCETQPGQAQLLQPGQVRLGGRAGWKAPASSCACDDKSSAHSQSGACFPICKHGACVPVAVSERGGGKPAAQVLRPQAFLLPNRRQGVGHGC